MVNQLTLIGCRIPFVPCAESGSVFPTREFRWPESEICDTSGINNIKNFPSGPGGGAGILSCSTAYSSKHSDNVV